MAHVNNNKIAVFLYNCSAQTTQEHADAATIKAGDTAIILEWDATDEYYDLVWKFIRHNKAIKMAKVLIACSNSNEAGKICFLEHTKLFVVKDEYINKLKDKAFCITGALEFEREVFISVLQSCGGKYKAQMSGKVDYLISARDDTVKAQKAREMGTTVINENFFYNKIVGSGKFGSKLQ